MPVKKLNLQRIKGAIPAWHGKIAEADLLPVCAAVREGGGRLLALWGSDERALSPEEAKTALVSAPSLNGFALHVVLVNETGLVALSLPLSAQQPVYPDLSLIFPAANRMQRAAYDLLGIKAIDAKDQRAWLRHAAWREGSFPLRKDFVAVCQHDSGAPAGEEASAIVQDATQIQDDYPFVQVEGQGVHEIPVGPVHAGIIEPGHFRFSVVGEKVLRLEARLGYTHKGIEKLLENKALCAAAKLVGRVSGDSTVAYAWAYAMAVEGVADITPPDRALWLRALFLERERIANHLGDLGYLGNDVALSFAYAQFWILKEQVLRNNATLFGHRYLMDKIIPGGVTTGIDESGKKTLRDESVMLEQEIHTLRSIFDEHAGVQDRYMGTGRVEPKLAAALGLCGLAGRASSQTWDSRVQFPCAPYDKLDVKIATHHHGDVAARVIVRFDELFESLRLQRDILINLIGGEDLAYPVTSLPPHRFGAGMLEGWRGEVMVAIHTDEKGNLTRVHPHDPSWQNWPALEHAIMGNIVPDFPLINKSFNLSYSGCDL